MVQRECGAVIARSAHSSPHLGVGLRILLTTREISPFCSLSVATERGFYYVSFSASLLLLFPEILLITGLCSSGSVSELLLLRAQSGRQKRRAVGFNKDACGVFVRVFLDRLTFFCRKEKRWERNCPRQLGRLKLPLRSPERLRLHPPRLTDR